MDEKKTIDMYNKICNEFNKSIAPNDGTDRTLQIRCLIELRHVSHNVFYDTQKFGFFR